jgi:two-component system cell cycle response regulator DivK
MSGVHLIEALKNDPRTKHIPIIAVTAFIWDNLSHAAGSVGCDWFVGKPFNSTRLLKEVRRILDPDLPDSPGVATIPLTAR